jgi:hypothetical protein
MSYSLPDEIQASLHSADEDDLMQRRARVQHTLEFIDGRSPVFMEGVHMRDAIERELLIRAATGRRQKERSAASQLELVQPRAA